MTVSVAIELGREFAVKASCKQVFALLSDVPRSAGHFPKVARLVDMGKGVYRWEMQRVGTPQVGIQTVYACRYVSDASKGSVVWTPLSGVGNAQVSGSWKIAGRKGRTSIVFQTTAAIEVDLPALMRVIVVPVVEHEFRMLVDQYIANLVEAFGGQAG